MTRTSGQAEGLSRNRKRTTSNSPTSCRHSRGRLPPPPTRLPNLITQSVYLLSISRHLCFKVCIWRQCWRLVLLAVPGEPPPHHTTDTSIEERSSCNYQSRFD